MNGIFVFASVMNLAALFMMGIDKAKARAGARRIPERTLFLPVLLLGGIGGTLGMLLFRHKTRHWYFKWGFPLIAAVEYALLFYLFA